ncbi:MAG: S8 family serine peptidase, partial [Bacteroidota bacterium]|nr:S8 family serine peptidase [Bacteroidota bacterium]MDX5429427.1 S8 family serine peptidase [Bacteroidota bacterium]MDX5468218.1 S8 family serine peptidase [Bacteroidota bacterium]
MKKIALTLSAVFSFTLLLAQVERPVFIENELYIGLKKEVASSIVSESGTVIREAFLQAFSEVIQPGELGNAEAPFFAAKGVDLQWVLRISVNNPERIEAFEAGFHASPLTHYAERVPILYLSYVPNDLGANSNNNQWHLYKIKAQQAWDISKGSKQVKVAIVDDAVQINHPDLADNIWVNPGEIANNGIDDDQNGYIDDVNGYDVGGLDNNPMPNNNNFTHGTHCAGISGATTDNNTGIASIGFNISIVPVKCTTTGQTNTQSIPRGYEGITYAVAAGADIISCSWGSSFGGSTGAQVVQNAVNNGAIVVAAMGNDNNEQLQYPASYTSVISVAATANNDSRASYSNYHSTTVISAPGNFIGSTL